MDTARSEGKSPDKIPAPAGEPSLEADELTADELTADEEANLSPKKQAVYYTRRFIQHLRGDIRVFRSEKQTLEAELKRLRIVEIEHVRLAYARSWQVFLSATTAVFVVLGSALIGSFPAPFSNFWGGVGWGAVFIGVVLQVANVFIKGVPNRKKESD